MRFRDQWRALCVAVFRIGKKKWRAVAGEDENYVYSIAL